MRAHSVLAAVSRSCSEPIGIFPRVTHPSAGGYCYPPRLACLRPAASVRSEPGSNSHVFDPSDADDAECSLVDRLAPVDCVVRKTVLTRVGQLSPAEHLFKT